MLIKGCLMLNSGERDEDREFLHSISLDRTLLLNSVTDFSDAVNDGFLPQLIIGDIGIVSVETLVMWKEKIGEPSEIITMSENIQDAEKCLSLKHISAFCLNSISNKNLSSLINRTLKKLVYDNKASLERQLTFQCGLYIQELNLCEVLYVENLGNNVRIVSCDNSFDTNESFSSLCSQLSGYTFIRVSPSLVVNVFEVDTISNTYLIIRDREIPIAENYRNKLARVFDMLFHIDLSSL